MEKTVKIFEDLQKKYPQWETYLEKKIYDEKCVDEIKISINEVLGYVKEQMMFFIDREDEEKEHELWNGLESFLEERVFEKIKDLLDQRLIIYRRTLVLRRDKIDMAKFIEGVFTNLSITYDPAFFSQNDVYGIKVREEFSDAAAAVDQVISVHVGRHFSKKAALKDFADRVGAGENALEVYGRLYEENYAVIQHNLYIDRVNELSRQIEFFMENLGDE